MRCQFFSRKLFKFPRTSLMPALENSLKIIFDIKHLDIIIYCNFLINYFLSMDKSQSKILFFYCNYLLLCYKLRLAAICTKGIPTSPPPPPTSPPSHKLSLYDNTNYWIDVTLNTSIVYNRKSRCFYN